MIAAIEQHDILPVALGTPLAILVALAAVAAWGGLHALKARTRPRWLRALLFAARCAVGFIALLAAFDVTQRGLLLATNWPIWPLALGGAVAIEGLLLLYALERTIVERRVGLLLAGLRVALVLLVLVMLAQPVRSVEWSRSLQRYVAVLVDRSASMGVPDSQLTPAEKVRLAEALAPGALRRPYRLDEIERELRRVREALSAHVDWLAALREAAPERRLKQLQTRYTADREALQELEERVTDLSDRLGEPLEGDLQLDAATRESLSTLRKALSADVAAQLADVAGRLTRDGLPALARDPGDALASLRHASKALAELGPKLDAAGDAVDEAFYAALDESKKTQADALSQTARLDLARRLLRNPDGDNADGNAQRPALLDQLQNERDYGVRLYAFDAEPVELDLDADVAEHTDTSSEGNDEEKGDNNSDLASQAQKTDLAAALEKVVTEMPAERLAGILLLTDGQHNASRPVEPLARRIGLQQVPISSVVFGGGRRPTTDAAIVSLNAPDSVFVRDKIYLNADVKLDGLKGRTVRVALFDGDEPVGSEEVQVQSDTLRTRIQLADEPEDTGLRPYRVKIEDLEGEVLATNNQAPLSVSVSDDQTRLLVLAGRPRWEFRYLKNLFASRDRTVKLQYVLLHPDTIPGQPPRPDIHASAARPKDAPEATAPPEDEAEWMKFDVMVLGDVEPSVLREEHLEAIRKFVTERAGTLIVVAGPRHMPHAYAKTALSDLLPVSFVDPEPDVSYFAPPEPHFRIALTAEGRQHVITRLKVDAEENLTTWNEVPDIYWRHPLPQAKEAATVLAYAMPPEPPDFLVPTRAHEVPSEEVLAQRRQFVRDRALIALHNVALGRVLFLDFDRTWRLRYRVGDTHHHRFWGQVLRWATADKLAAGTDFVKVGTDRPRYPANANVRVQAKITTPDYSPVVSEKVFAKVFSKGRLVLRKKMDYVPNSLGNYAADLGSLPGGTYRFELEAPEAKALLAEEGAENVSTEFFVEDAVPAEQVELAANRGLLERLATLTGGVTAEPHRAADALAAFGEPVLRHSERRQWSLWDSWPFLVLIVLVAGTEWYVRKRARLP